MSIWAYLIILSPSFSPRSILFSSTASFSLRLQRNWFRSPFSMYSVIIHRGSVSTQTASRRTMLGSLRRDMIRISLRKSFLRSSRDRNCCNLPLNWRPTHILFFSSHKLYLAFLLASSRSVFTATSSGESLFSSMDKSSSKESWMPSASHKCTCFKKHFVSPSCRHPTPAVEVLPIRQHALYRKCISHECFHHTEMYS